MTKVIGTLEAGHALVRLRVRVPTLAQVPTTVRMMLLQILRTTNTTGAEVLTTSVTKQMENPLPVNVIIAAPTLRVRLLVRGLLWVAGMTEVAIQA